jgi:two-component system, response regulator PdtaR
MLDGKPSVLVVDDEALVRMGIVGELIWAGFDVHEARNSEDAMKTLATHGGIDVVFTDVDMPPGEYGLQLAALIRDRWPPMKIIVTSGHRMVDARSLPIEALFIPKPYHSEHVATSMREMLLS